MILWGFSLPESRIIARSHSIMIILTQLLYTKAAKNGDLDKNDHTKFAQPSKGGNSQGSARTNNGLDSQEPRTPNVADLPGTDSQGNDISFLSNISEVRKGLSRTAISDGDGDASLSTQRASRKRGRESEPKKIAKKAKQGGRRRSRAGQNGGR